MGYVSSRQFQLFSLHVTSLSSSLLFSRFVLSYCTNNSKQKKHSCTFPIHRQTSRENLSRRESMMESSADDRRSHSGSSSDMSVSFEAEVPRNPNDEYATPSSGKLERDVQTERNSGESSSAVRTSSGSSQLTASARLSQNQALSVTLAKLFDQRTPFRKKRKYIKQLATVKDDGTVQFDVPGDIKPQYLDFGTGAAHSEAASGAEACGETEAEVRDIPPLQIVMLIVGTRGDVQPFVAIGKRLQEYGHRVRLATHANFKDFVLTAGLEFYPLGGDPKVLAGYMVKNKGFLPSGPSEISIQRQQLREIIFSLLPACKEPDPDSKVPFKAEAIIANPPAYGHSHVAEALKVPLHIFFTMPWTPTNEFPHPLSRVTQPIGYRLSYQIVDALIWLGIRDMINEFRKKMLKLRPITYLSGNYSSQPDVPHGYIWSPHLVPKPKDWGPNIDVVGFCFLDLASNYEPPEPLAKWLEAGDEPVYIGFGSLPLQEPEKMTDIILQALEITGQRGIINRGWGGLGNSVEPSDSVYLVDNCPHDWLFKRCSAVVHHGGAGTTAAGLKAACPTTIIPFFGDQPFWGERVHARGVGPAPIPVEEFSLDKLVDAIRFMLDPKVKECAIEIAKAMDNEDGVRGAVKAFHRHFPCNRSDDGEPDQSLPARKGLLSIRRCFG
ncbi:hypothetical protein ACFX13_034478 [Malus domestica]